jgi:hypothetical protein
MYVRRIIDRKVLGRALVELEQARQRNPVAAISQLGRADDRLAAAQLRRAEHRRETFVEPQRVHSTELRMQEQVRVLVEDGFAELSGREVRVDEQQVRKPARHELGADGAAGTQVSLPGRLAHHVDLRGGSGGPYLARQRAREHALEARDLPRDAAGVHTVGDDQRISGGLEEAQRADIRRFSVCPHSEA